MIILRSMFWIFDALNQGGYSLYNIYIKVIALEKI